jgi:long-chain acyl-CoA synthetase
MLTLPSILTRTHLLYGQRTAIRDAEGDLTWTQYVERIAQAAGTLAAGGLRRGDRYAILSRNSVRHAELLCAGYWLGAVPVPINFRLAPGEIAAAIEDAECQLLVIENVFAGLLSHEPLAPWRGRAVCIGDAPEAADVPSYEALKSGAAAIEPNDPSEDDDAIILYTGATTGRGKGVRLTHRNIVANALQLGRIMNVGPDDLYLHVSPMFHSTDLKATVLTLHGGAHAYLPEFSPRAVLSAIARHRVTIASLVPTMLIRLLQDPELGRHDLSSLRLISYGTSPMAVEWIRRVMQAFPGVGLHQVYGLTETAPVLTILDEADHRRGLDGEARLLRAAGRPLPGVDIRIVDARGRDRPHGEAGEIVVRGPQVAKGYHNRPHENAAAFRHGWFHTGDIGRIDSDGYLFVLDRLKDVVITGGENVFTSEVEAAIYEHPGVQEVAVVGVPDEQFGEALLAVIVPAPGHSLGAAEIIAHCRGRIGGFKIPRRMIFTDALPKNTMGKVLKQKIRLAYRDECAKAGSAGAPTTAV